MNILVWSAAGGLVVGGSELAGRTISKHGFAPRSWLQIATGMVLLWAGALALVAGAGQRTGPWLNGVLIAAFVPWFIAVILRMVAADTSFPLGPVTTALYGAVALVVVVVLPTVSSWEWGGHIRDSVGRGTLDEFGPLTLELVIEPTAGTARAGDESSCALRVAERVFLGRDVVGLTRFAGHPDYAAGAALWWWMVASYSAGVR